MATLSRRSFLLGSGVAALAAGAGLVGCGSNRPAPVDPDEQKPAQSDQADEPADAGEQPVAQAAEPAAEPTKLNPQDYDYRSNSGNLSHVLSPWSMGGMNFTNRIVKSAAGSSFKGGGWDVFIEYYEHMAQGGVEMIWVENFFHALVPYTNRLKDNIDEVGDKYDVPLLVDRLHEAGAKAGTQIDTMASSFMTEIKGRGGYDAQYLTVEEIDYLVQSYVDTAKIIHDFGFDAYELNCAGENVPQWFLAPARNHRDDDYGCQTYENRTRFIRRVIEGIQEVCGEDWPLQVLIDGIEENDEAVGQNAELNTVEDGIEIAKILQDAGIASLHVRLGPMHKHVCQFMSDLYFDTFGCEGSTGFGSQFDFTRHFQGKLIANHSGCGMMLDVAKQYKEALSIPVGTVTYMDPAHAPDFFDKAVADGKVDFLIMNRPLNVDPDYVNKLKEGRFDKIRPCTRCGHCFNDTTKESNATMGGYGTSLACRIDPIRGFIGNDRGLPGGWIPDPVEGAKSVMVVGAGPAGMEAARIAARRGCDVTLYERSGAIGGLLTFASVIKGPHENLDDYVAWVKKQLELEGVKVVTGKEVDAAFVKERKPDAVILALGGKRDTLKLTAASGTNVVAMDDIVAAEIGQNVTIVGSNLQATDVAFYLLDQGKNVTIVTPDTPDMLSKGQSLWAKTFSAPMLYSRGTRVWNEAELSSIGGGKATVKTKAGAEVTYDCDTVIEAMDMLPNKDLLDELSGMEVHAVGDCDDPYNIQYAIRAGNFCARSL